ncbi:hypothetical protein [Mesorhizobium sp. M0410]|uniref:hypothetical protein n=1 Tax=Mesorhizobium sp. M0410 TaxID=2956943 RepID=UPI00333CFE20
MKWVASRVRDIGHPDYHQTLHFDVYRSIGLEFGLDPLKVFDFITEVSDAVPEFILNIESPADFGSTQAQFDNYAQIVSTLDARSSHARIVVDARVIKLSGPKLTLLAITTSWCGGRVPTLSG